MNIFRDFCMLNPGRHARRLLKNSSLEIQSSLNYQECLKSPFEKGGFRGISGGYKITPSPISVRYGNCVISYEPGL